MPTMVSHKRRRGKRRRKDNTPIIIAVVAGAVIFALLVFGIVKLVNKDKTSEILESGIELEAKVSVDGIDISGLMESQARKKLEEKYAWKMTATLDGAGGGTYEISNLISSSINSVLDDIYGTEQPKPTYTIIFNPTKEELDAEIAAMQQMWNVEAKNGSIASYDPETEAFTFSEGEDGFEIDADRLKNDILSALGDKDFKKNIKVNGKTTEPEFNEETAKQLYKTIGTYMTKSTANADRNNNLNLACAAVNGTILQPEEEFSFNLTTGNRTVEKGYKAAGAYQNGELVEEPGGGVCQVASTLYNAVIFSGLKVTERHAHTYEPTYVTPGEDATVSYDGYTGPDLKFTNTTSAAIVILAKYKEQTVTCSIIGIPILAEGETYTLHSVKDEGYQPPVAATISQEDYTIPPHTEVIVQKGDQGSRWTTYITHTINGVVESDEVLHTSTYKGHTPKVKLNPSDFQFDLEGNILASSFEVSTPEGQIETISAPGTESSLPSLENTPSSNTESKPEIKPEPENSEAESYNPDDYVPNDDIPGEPVHPGF